MLIANQPIIRNNVASHPFRSKIDMSNAYYQIRVEPADEIKNLITAGQLGAFHIEVMLQGDCNAPATIMRIINTILSPYLGKFVWVYLDDILIFSNTYNDWLNHLPQIFKKLEENNFYLRMDKCNLLVNDIEVLGQTIKGNQITPAKEKITHINYFPTPTSKRQLQQFLGSVNYIGSHIPHIATLQAPLTELTDTQTWEWCDLLDNAFNQIKEVCNRHLPISPINYDKLQDQNTMYNLYLVTYASKVGVGSVLCHGKTFEEAKKNVAAIYSRKFTPALCNYTSTDQELLAIIDRLRTFEQKLLGVKFIIVPDHMALRTLMTQTVRNQRQIRLLETIAMFDFDIQHIHASENILVDALSRIYDGVKEADLTREHYLQEEQKYLNTDVFLHKDSSSPMPYFSSNHYNPYLTITLTPSPKPEPVIPILHHDASSTATQRTTPERLTQDALPPWRHRNFSLSPTTTPVQAASEAQVIGNAVGGVDYVRRLLWE